MMRPLIVLVALIGFSTAAVAQNINGAGNGNGNVGFANGVGNGNGSGNTLANTANNNASVTTVLAGGSRQGNLNNTPSVFAPGLAAAGVESCIASASAGGSGAGFGVTIALTTQDQGCNLRLFARTLYSMGHRTAATQLLCNDPQVAQALALEGIQCRVGEAAQAAARYQALAPEPATQTAQCLRYDLFGNCLEVAQPVVEAVAETISAPVVEDAAAQEAPPAPRRMRAKPGHARRMQKSVDAALAR